jgi:hypothetical protein
LSLDIENLENRLKDIEAKVKRLENRPLTDLTQYEQLRSLLVLAEAARNILQEKNPELLREIVVESRRLQSSAQLEGAVGVNILLGPED